MGDTAALVRNQQDVFNLPFAGESEKVVIRSFEECIELYRFPQQDPMIVDLTEIVLSFGRRFIRNFFLYARSCREKGLPDFEAACKARNLDLVNLQSRLSELEGPIEVHVLMGENLYANPNYFSRRGSVMAFHLEDESLDKLVYQLIKHPKWYSPLFAGVIRCMDLAFKLRDDYPPSYFAARELSLILVGLGRLYLEFRSTKEMKRIQEESILQQLKMSFSLDKDSKWYQHFLKVQQDIKEGKLPYVRDICAAIYSNELYLRSPFTEKDYYFSGKATSASMDGKKEKSIYSSCYEIDPFRGHRIDEAIGYKSNYNLRQPVNYYDPIVQTIGIDQHKIKERIIHIFSNAVQDRGRYIENRLLKVLSAIPSDCTKDQRHGVRFLEKITSRDQREARNWPSVIATDYSNMTDTLSQEFQIECLRILPFKSEVIDFLEDIMKVEKEFHFTDGRVEKYVQRSGQPQGFLPSFAMFAFAHHILRLMIMVELRMTYDRARDHYVILGDDNASTSLRNDSLDLHRQAIEDASKWVNIEINKDKSRYVASTDKIATLDFASVTVTDGRRVTPPPIRLLSRCAGRNSNYYSFTLVAWMGDTGYNLFRGMSYFLKKYYGDCDQKLLAAEVLMFGGIIPQFDNFTRYEEFLTGSIVPHEYPELLKAQLALCYLTVKIKGTLVETFLSDKAREQLLLGEFSIDSAIDKLIPKNKGYLLEMIEDMNHKFITAIKQNLTIEDSLKIITGVDEPGYLLPFATDLQDEEKVAIRGIAELIEMYLEGTLTDTSLLTVLEEAKVLKRLSRFNLRSFRKSVALEFYFFKETISLFLERFPPDSRWTLKDVTQVFVHLRK